MPQQHAHYAWATTVVKLIIFVAYGACWVCLCWHNPPNSDMDYRIFIVRTDVNAWNCTQGCTDTEGESALKVDSGKKIPCRTGESNLRQPTELHPIPYNNYLPVSLWGDLLLTYSNCERVFCVCVVCVCVCVFFVSFGVFFFFLTYFVSWNGPCAPKDLKWHRKEHIFIFIFLFAGFPWSDPPSEGRPGISGVSPLSGISGQSFDSTLLSPLLFFCLVLLPFLSYRFLPAGPFF